MFDFFISLYINLERGYHYIVKDFLFIVGIIIVNYTIPRWKEEKQSKVILKSLLYMIGVWLTLIVLSSFVYRFISSGMVYAIAFPIVSILYAFVLSKDRWIERLTMGISFYILFIYSIRSCDTFSYIILNTKEYVKNDPTSVKIDILRSVFSLLLTSIEVFILSMFNTRKCKVIDTWASLILPLIFFIVHFYQTFSNKGTWTENAIGNTLFVIILYLVYIMFYLASQEYNKKIEYQFIANQNNQRLEQINLLNNSYEDFKKIRHEIKNQYAIMQTLLENKEYEKVQQLFGSFNNQLLNIVKYYDCGNETINPLLNIEASKAKKQNIETDFEVIVSPKLNMEDSDIISLLSNLIDNSIEAMERYQCFDKPITLKMWEQNGSLFILTQNYVPDNQIDINNLSTKKEDKDSHGFGIKIIKKIVTKYNGYITMSSQNNTFTVDIYLPLKGEPQE